MSCGLRDTAGHADVDVYHQVVTGLGPGLREMIVDRGAHRPRVPREGLALHGGPRPEARELGLYSSITDNGAGGLSSSVGEMAGATGGARIDLARAPLKYPGLAPWEILISEAQERMTLAVPPAHIDAFLALAQRREVEASVLGEFTDSGRLVVTHGATPVCDLALEFLHDGLPRWPLRARWSPPARPRSPAASVHAALADASLASTLPALLGVAILLFGCIWDAD